MGVDWWFPFQSVRYLSSTCPSQIERSIEVRCAGPSFARRMRPRWATGELGEAIATKRPWAGFCSTCLHAAASPDAENLRNDGGRAGRDGLVRWME